MRVSAEPVSSFFASRAAAEISPPVSQRVRCQCSESSVIARSAYLEVLAVSSVAVIYKIREGRKPPLNPPQHSTYKSTRESCSGTTLVHVQRLIRASDSSAWRRRGERPRLV